MEKNYDLLHPFDLEKAKAGEEICRMYEEPVVFVAEDKSSMCSHGHCVRYLSGGLGLLPPEYLRMKPLCWVEGKPVYKGDVLYYNDDGETTSHVSESYDEVRDAVWWEDGGRVGYVIRSHLTWTPPAKPKVKKEGWVNVYQQGVHKWTSGNIFNSVYALRLANETPCGDYKVSKARIEWEE